MKKYRARSGYMASIDVVEVERETGSSVWIGGNRRAKRAEFESYFDSWDEAKAHLVALAEVRVGACRASLDRAVEYLEQVEGWRKVIE